MSDAITAARASVWSTAFSALAWCSSTQDEVTEWSTNEKSAVMEWNAGEKCVVPVYCEADGCKLECLCCYVIRGDGAAEDSSVCDEMKAIMTAQGVCVRVLVCCLSVGTYMCACLCVFRCPSWYV